MAIDPPYRFDFLQNLVNVSWGAASRYLIVDVQLWIDPVSYTPTTYGAGPPLRPPNLPGSNGYSITANKLTAANLIVYGTNYGGSVYTASGFPVSDGPIPISVPEGAVGYMWHVLTEVECDLDSPFTGADHTAFPQGHYQLSFRFLAWDEIASGTKYNWFSAWTGEGWTTVGQFWIISPNETYEFEYTTNILCDQTIDFTGATLTSTATDGTVYRAIGTTDPGAIYMPYNVQVAADPHGVHYGEVYNGYYRTGAPPVKHVVRIIFKAEEPTA